MSPSAATPCFRLYITKSIPDAHSRVAKCIFFRLLIPDGLRVITDVDLENSLSNLHPPKTCHSALGVFEYLFYNIRII